MLSPSSLVVEFDIEGNGSVVTGVGDGARTGPLRRRRRLEQGASTCIVYTLLNTTIKSNRPPVRKEALKKTCVFIYYS